MARRGTTALIAAILGCIMLIGLGVWQLYRLQWKEDLIAQMDERFNAAPVSLSDAIKMAADGKPVEFLRMKTRGTFRHDAQMFMLTTQDGMPGWDVVAPLVSSEGAAVLVDRGFVPDELRDPAKRPGSEPQGAVEVTGYVSRHVQRRGLFAPDNDTARNNWYWWDVPAMLAFAKIDPGMQVAPFVLHVLSGGDERAVPRPPAPATDLRNNHLQYALTWFGLAVALAAIAFFFIRGEAKRTGA